MKEEIKGLLFARAAQPARNLHCLSQP